MIRGLKIANFRSIKKAEFELAPITVVYGQNGTGKSGLLYTLLVFKNILLNSNQASDAFFNLSFANLGGFEQVIFDHLKDSTMSIGISLEQEHLQLKYGVSVGAKAGEFTLDVSGDWNTKLRLPVTFPYPANQQAEATLKVGENDYTAKWNGLVATQVTPVQATPETEKKAQDINVLLNYPTEMLRQVDFVPLRRGFSKPQYQPVPASPIIMGEDEVANLLSQDRYLSGKLSVYLERITNREFRSHVPPGTSFFYPLTVEKSSGMTTELVNNGFGINQLVYFLAKALRPDTHLVCIEEPEIHLHPTGVRKLVEAIVRMTKEEEKQFFISTHSESLVLALLSQVARHELEPQQLACYLTVKRKKVTGLERQKVKEGGQLEGGLKSFMEAELEDLKTFFGA